VLGSVEVTDGTFSKTIYAGTCSDADCVPHEVASGRLQFTNANYQAEFAIENDMLWLKSGSQATLASVKLGTTYVAPQNSDVTVTFTQLPENPGSLTIEEIILSDEQVEMLGALSNVAYDITSSMENKSFQYELTLPKPETSDQEFRVVYADSADELANANVIHSDSVTVDESVVARGLDHFTVFVVTNNASVCPGGAYSSGVCYATIQEAINAADPSDGIDTIEVDAGIYTENLTISKSIILEGANSGVNPNTESRGSESTIIGQISVTASNVIIDGLKISNPTYSGPTIRGIHLYKNGSYITNIEIKNNVFEEINNANNKGSYAVMVQAGIDTVNIVNNKINNLYSAGWTHAIEVTPSGGGVEVPRNIVITGNVISNISNATHMDEYAFSVDWSSSNVLFADASEVTFSNNTILGGSVRNLDEKTVDDYQKQDVEILLVYQLKQVEQKFLSVDLEFFVVGTAFGYYT
jgi:hypothetical protein